MYQLIQLSDLESDFINPHDATRNMNWVVVRLLRVGSVCLGVLAGGCRALP